jgi:hypothetical protein
MALIYIKKVNLRQYTMRFLLSRSFILVIVLFVAGCNLSGSGGNTSQSPKEAKGIETETFTPISSGDSLPNGTLQDKLLVIAQRTDKNVIYDIAIDSDASYSPLIVRTQGKNVTIRIHSASVAIRTLTLNTQGSLFNVGANTTLILENIILKGHPHNNMALISVTEGGALFILDDTIIRDNQNENPDGYDGYGGGINVGIDSRLFMKGGEICHNFIKNGSGGGVYIQSGGFFNMTGGIIHHNEAEISSGGYGGGVCISGGILSYTTFTMNGGEIASNTAFLGGGVYISGKFVKEPLPNQTRSGIIWGYPANGRENYANGAAIYWAWLDSVKNNNGTFGEYDHLNTDWGQEWLFQ